MKGHRHSWVQYEDYTEHEFRCTVCDAGWTRVPVRGLGLYVRDRIVELKWRPRFGNEKKASEG